MKPVTLDPAPKLTRRANLFLVALCMTTLGIWRSGTDPVNIPKLLILSGFSGLILGSVLTSKSFRINRWVLFVVCFFVFTLFIPVVFSGAPLVQQLFGVSGRNTGLLTYIFLAILFYGASSLTRLSDYEFVPRAVLISGYGSVLFCTLELLGVNLLGASNTFGAILGTFGNPNFVSAFSGMIAVGSFALFLKFDSTKSSRVAFSTLATLSFFMVIQSKSFQGLGATFLGAFLVLALYLFTRKYKKLFLSLITFGGASLGLLVLGLLDKGPLSTLIYQYTLPLRLQYWQAGITMLKDRPFAGVGLNSYGDWYRESRDADSLISPGPNVTTNVAHNVYIDFASNGGLFLGISSILLFATTLFFVVKTIWNMKAYDPSFTSTSITWILYSIQAFFSIDQIGLSIWGWTLGGALIGMAKLKTLATENNVSKSIKSSKSTETNDIARNDTRALIPQFVLFWVFVLAAFPAFKADLDWAEARRMGKVETLASQLNKWPQDEVRYSRGTYLFLTNKFEPQALASTLEGLEIFPRSSALWSYLYQNPVASSAQRNLAREKLISLDPLNSENLSLKKF
jgi:O-antigen ligase